MLRTLHHNSVADCFTVQLERGLIWEVLEKVPINHCLSDMSDGVGSSGEKQKSAGDDIRTTVPISDNKQPLPEKPTAVATASIASQQWRDYLDRVLDLCRNADEIPAARLFQPPPELLSNPRSRHPAEPGPTISDVEARESVGSGGIGGECGGRNSGNPGANEGGVLRLPTNPSDAYLVLVLLDMNGTLLYRAKKPLPIIVPDADGGDTAHAFVHGDPLPLHYYMRPGAKEFVAAMARHPRVRLAFYTSMRGVNAIPAARFLMPDDVNGTDEGGADLEVYDRPFNAHDPEGANPWDTTRNLPLVWSTPGRAGEGFGPGNTVMVDDTPKKMRFMDSGLVVVPEYTEASVVDVFRGGAGTRGSGDDEDGVCEEGGLRREHEERAHRQMEVMSRLTEYMRRLLEHSGEDVRPFIANNPFLPHAPSEPAEYVFSVPPVPARHGRTVPLPPASVALKEDDPTSANLATVDPRSLPPAPRSPAGETFGGGDQGAFCFVDAVGILLTTGPLVRLPRQTVDARGTEPSEGEVGNGRFIFDEFPRGLEASVVDAVAGLLRAACDAARRWELLPAEREMFAAWSRVATVRFSS